jgi:diguanylate cyclase (GGDEF)-like protein
MEQTIHMESEHVALGVMRDISDQKALEERLRAESVTDELTGLFNRKQFNRDLKRYYSEFIRSGNNSAIIMYDFDHFKSVNDRYGHAMGDRVLFQAAGLVREQLRPSDHAYRLGGEEFAILLRGTSTGDAGILADRVRQTIAAARFRLDGSRVSVTVSFGVARFQASDRNYEDTLKRADDALYRSKAEGRNTINIID